jgi:hypothetical protein
MKFSTSSGSSKKSPGRIEVAPGGRAIDLILSSEMLKKLRKWERVTYKWKLDAEGELRAVGFRQARDDEPVLEMRQYATGWGFRIPLPSEMTVERDDGEGGEEIRQ